jgi:hypothetical protein
MIDEPKCPFCNKSDAGCGVEWLSYVPDKPVPVERHGYLMTTAWKCHGDIILPSGFGYSEYKNRPIEDALNAELAQAQARVEELERIVKFYNEGFSGDMKALNGMVEKLMTHMNVQPPSGGK